MMAAIFAAIQSIPMVLKLVQDFVLSFQEWQLNNVLKEYTSKDKQRLALLSILKKESVTDEERKNLVRLLYDINHNP